jgi:hypothetical protein
MIAPIIRGIGIVATVSLLLGGCAYYHEVQKQRPCPGASVLATAASLTVFRENMPTDPAGELYTVEMTDLNATCDIDPDARESKSSIVVSFRATRAPSSERESYRVPYFVAVLQAGNILSKTAYWVDLTFAPGAATTTFTENLKRTVIKIDLSKQAYDYGILVGLQLTHAQLDYNKKMRRYAP